MDANIENLIKALEEYNSKTSDFYRSLTNPDKTINNDPILDYVESELSWNTPEEFENLLIKTQNSVNWDSFYNPSHLNDLSNFNNQIENHDIINDFTRIISETTRYLKKGNFDIIPKYVDRLNSIVDYDYLNIKLEEYNIDIEELLKLLETIINNIDFDISFDSFEKSIPKNIIELNEEIIYQISRNPELMYSIEPRLFEELISKILQKFRIKTELTKQTRDGGYDIIAIDDKNFSKNKYLIECKRYSPDNKVDVSIVRGLYGVKTDNKATKGLLITSSFFTRDAKEFAKRNAWELELYDYNDIVNWLKKYWK